VFVHGLGGDAAFTWGLGLFRKLRASAKASRYDIYSVAYDSFRPALLSTSELMKFSSAVCDEPLKIFNASVNVNDYQDKPPPRGPFSYAEVVYICHSLGGLLFRRMAAEAHLQGAAWIDRVRAILFAPAHRGGRPLQLAMEALGPWIAAAVRIQQYQLPVLQDLDPKSTFVQHTQERTTAALTAIGNRPKSSLICSNVAHADRDRIVDLQSSFCADPLPDILYDHSHTSVCKVTEEREDALIYLLQALS
jgi:pimeloyl-ACP methyl ester carboxylesterase